MGHKTLIGGTAYEISGGKTLVNGTAYSIDKGKTLVGGTAYEVGFGSWPEDLDTGLEFVSASPFTVSVSNPKWDGTMEYCNGDGWKTWNGSTISSGKKENGQCIYIRGTGNSRIGYTNSSYKWTLTGTDIECNGDIGKLLDYDTVKAGGNPYNTSRASCFAFMFYGCTALTSAPALPATKVGRKWYDSMFQGCTALKSAPALPATVLDEGCYISMFDRCTALTSAPALPATELAYNCYRFMFEYCTALTSAPSLPATTLADGCYYCMFNECTALTSAPSLPATTLAEDCYKSMFAYCTALTSAPSLPATTLADGCYRSMFDHCTALTDVPSLPATTLASNCYSYMFSACEKIKLSVSKGGTYGTAYRIPTSGTGTTEATYTMENMFKNTGGTFKGTPTINTTYYLDSSNTIV